MKKALVLVFIILFAFILVACSANSGSYKAALDSAEKSGIKNTEIILSNANMKLVYTVNATIYSDDVMKSLDEIKALVASYAESGDYIESQELSVYDEENSHATIVVKVFTEHLNEFTTKLPSYGEVRSFSQSSENITEKYANLDAMLNAYKTELAYYQELIEDEAVKSQPSVAAQYYTRITELNTQISYYEQELTKYNNDLDYSTVTISIETANESSAIDGKDIAIIILVILLVGSIVFFVVKSEIKRKQERNAQGRQ